MEEKEIIEGNTMIHDWMGHRRMKSKGWEHCWIGAEKAEDLKYHMSWSWLMPVVLKIEECGKLVRIEGYVCEMTAAVNENPRFPPFKIKRHRNSKIQATWEACIEFIKWHNEASK